MRTTVDRNPLSGELEPRDSADQEPTILLQKLAVKGAWRSILEAVRGQQAATQEQMLCNAAYLTLAYAKLRMSGAATAELQRLGNLDAPHFTTATESGLHVSMVPFVLRWLQADSSEQPAPMYQLLDYCSQQLTHTPQLAATLKTLQASQRLHSISLKDDDFTSPGPSRSAESESERHVRVWARRQHMVICNLVTRHVRSKEYKVALQWLSWLLRERGDDPAVWSVVGYIQLMLGDVNTADCTFQKASKLMSSAQTPEQQRQAQALVHHQQGLLLFARNDFAGALAEFEASATDASQAAAAAQGKAMVHVYRCNMSAAIQVTEQAVQSSVLTYISEPLLANLCTMYEAMDTSGQDGLEAKSRLQTLLGPVVPDDFDLSIVKANPV